ncbi:MAG: glutamate--tRNA ligase, partial [Lentisphaeria bacterium]|nr:glutamate--tRNA ligase [Lentisphaeria bacterium]
KFMKDESARKALALLAEKLLAVDENAPAGAFEQAIREAEEAFGIQQGKLNQPVRVALTGVTVGAGVYETAEILKSASCARRIARALKSYEG